MSLAAASLNSRIAAAYRERTAHHPLSEGASNFSAGAAPASRIFSAPSATPGASDPVSIVPSDVMPGLPEWCYVGSMTRPPGARTGPLSIEGGAEESTRDARGPRGLPGNQAGGRRPSGAAAEVSESAMIEEIVGEARRGAETGGAAAGPRTEGAAAASESLDVRRGRHAAAGSGGASGPEDFLSELPESEEEQLKLAIALSLRTGGSDGESHEASLVMHHTEPGPDAGAERGVLGGATVGGREGARGGGAGGATGGLVSPSASSSSVWYSSVDDPSSRSTDDFGPPAEAGEASGVDVDASLKGVVEAAGDGSTIREGLAPEAGVALPAAAAAAATRTIPTTTAGARPASSRGGAGEPAGAGSSGEDLLEWFTREHCRGPRRSQEAAAEVRRAVVYVGAMGEISPGRLFGRVAAGRVYSNPCPVLCTVGSRTC